MANVKFSQLTEKTPVATNDYVAIVDTDASASKKVLVSELQNKLAIGVSINLNSGTAQTLYTVPTGKSCVILWIVLRNFSTTVGNAKASAGWNDSSYNDVMTDTSFVPLTSSATACFACDYNNIFSTIGTTGQVLKLKVNTLEGSALTAKVDVIGYLV